MELVSRTIALISLIILSPFLLIISIICFAFQGYPILFKQKRVGYKYNNFYLYKFRTMVPNTGNKITALNDGRVTYLGKILRFAKFDELPQLINIIKGDMRFIGPRPEVREYFDKEKFSFLLKVKPGISCFASIFFRKEYRFLEMINNKDPYLKILNVKIELAKYYSNEKSFILDLKIVFITIISLFYHNGAILLIKYLLPLEKLEVTKNFILKYT